MKLFVRSGEWPKMAEYELEQVIQAKKWAHGKQISTCENAQMKHHKRLALSKEAYEVLHAGDEQDVKEWCEKNPQKTTKSVRVSWKGIEGLKARTLLIRWLNKPRVDLNNPKEEYALIVDEKKTWYVCKKIWENTQDWNERKSHNRAAPHPTAMHPKLARAMINLSGAEKEVLDPFCGAGGILLEGALMKLYVTGIDIDAKMIERSFRNLRQFYGCKEYAMLKLGDAREWDHAREAIITDLPYGRNSKADDLETLYTEFLNAAKKMTKKMVVAFPDSVDVKRLVKESGWKEKAQFIVPLHRSLRKVICVLEN